VPNGDNMLAFSTIGSRVMPCSSLVIRWGRLEWSWASQVQCGRY